MLVRFIPRGRWQVPDTATLSFPRSREADCSTRPITVVPGPAADGWAGLKRSQIPGHWLRLDLTSAAAALDYLVLRAGLVTKAHG